jgi:hypothetical protein
MIFNNLAVWTVEKGETTEIKIDDTIFAISKNRHCSVDPMEVAKMFVDTFERIPKVAATIHPEKVNSTTIFTDDLKWLYHTFQDCSFTREDVYKNSSKRFGIGYVRINDYLTYLEKNKFVKADVYNKDYREEKHYRFAVPIEEWDDKKSNFEINIDFPSLQECDIKNESPATHGDEPEFIPVPTCKNMEYKNKKDQVEITYKGCLITCSWKNIIKLSQYPSSKLGNEVVRWYRGADKENTNKRIALYAIVMAYKDGKIKPGCGAGL